MKGTITGTIHARLRAAMHFLNLSISFFLYLTVEEIEEIDSGLSVSAGRSHNDIPNSSAVHVSIYVCVHSHGSAQMHSRH